MALLTDLLAPGDSQYRRAAGSSGPATPIARAGRTALLCAALLLAGLVVGASARQTHASEPAARAARDQLVDRVRTRTAQTDALQNRFADARSGLDAASADVAATDSALSGAQSDLSRLSPLSGVADVHVPGLKVVVDDAADSGSAATATGRIRDTDLQRLVNGLWGAGAEAVSVNGHRLTMLTSIRTAGNAILVAYHPLTLPYEVLAIGSPTDLEVDFVDGPGGHWFKALHDRYGIKFAVTTVADVTLARAPDATLRVAETRAQR
jgi:uncharacterized protein YlxW (UPF0749 family)